MRISCVLRDTANPRALRENATKAIRHVGATCTHSDNSNH